ncbi:Predicted transcriptional regulator, ArsR family [Actinopolymorpha cephalotaxi]|uniref:Predicted transcriptional regulator, ArsR family n=1 Tax=Actinopolymorpha cephalotaxi TaxID=504797 RepID=A0A1I2R198_9ACTN|nr:Predicted transcriptional regulator, ArsR family [Actinopolymorpha cephalotaxi]
MAPAPLASHSTPPGPAPAGVSGAAHADAEAGHESTRERVARVILERGPQTAAALADQLGVTPAAIRRHLDAMVAEGVVAAREQRVRGPRGRGRPAKVFAITDEGRSAFHQAYDDLAVSALRYIRETGGEDALEAFARLLVGRLEERYRSVATAFPADEGTTALAEALSEDGYAASVEPAGTGEQLCQHHCPVAHVAEQFPQLCEAETEVFSRLLGRHVQRLATIAHGDGVCTTHVPRPGGAGRSERPQAPEGTTTPTNPTNPTNQTNQTNDRTTHSVRSRTGRNSS